MSWQIGTFVILMLALGSGMLWYERSKPPSQIVALVAVLAALAVAGRIVLAPIPNVVATTDIVFFAGYVLGPAPGFAVGALGGLVSNFWLGQGVWTPWQMVGWGMTGIAGGALWYLTRGRANRFHLALACGAAGLVFGAWMNFQTMVSYGGDISLDRYLVLEARAIPFDLAHITGNVIFALAAGPTIVSALRRFRERFEWRQVTPVVGSLFVAIALATAVSAPNAKAATTDEAASAAQWLRSQQNDDGGFGLSPGSDSSIGITSRAMLGFAAADLNPLDVVRNENTPLDYLVARRNSLTQAGDIALAILALKTVGVNPRKFKGRDLVKALRVRGGNGMTYGNKVNTAAYAAIAFRTFGADGSKDKVLDFLRSAQKDNGGWGISPTANSDPDTTGTVLQAYFATKAVRAAMGYLNKTQTDSGGWASSGTVNTQSTGLVVQGSIAVNKGAEYLRKNGNSGLDFILARQQDDGSIWYSRSSDTTRVWVTSDAIVALAQQALPIKEPAREADDNDKNTNDGGVSPSDPPANTTPPSSTGTFTPDLSDTGSSGSSNSGSSGNGNSSGGDFKGSNSPTPPSNGGGNDQSTDTDVPDTPTDTGVPVVPVAPTEAILTASKAGPQPSPIVALLVCLLVSGGLAGGTFWLTRRFGW